MQIWANHFSSSLAMLSREENLFAKVLLVIDCKHILWLGPAPQQVTITQLLPTAPLHWLKTCLGPSMGVQSNAALPSECGCYPSGQPMLKVNGHGQLTPSNALESRRLHPGFSKLWREPNRWVTFGLEQSIFCGILVGRSSRVYPVSKKTNTRHKHAMVRGSLADVLVATSYPTVYWGPILCISQYDRKMACDNSPVWLRVWLWSRRDLSSNSFSTT